MENQDSKKDINSCKVFSPLITIITVVYNGVNCIEKTIQSVISQKYEGFEYIIIDGKSTDGTVEIIKKYSDFIDFFLSESDRGVSNAFNKGIALAKGEWIGIVNCGDVLLQDDLRKISKILYECENENIGIVRFQNRMLYKDGRSGIRLPSMKYPLFPHKFRACHMGCYIRKSILNEHMYDETLKICMDIDLLYRLHLCGICEKEVNTSVGIFVVDINSVSRKNTTRKAYEIVHIAKKNGMIFPMRVIYLIFLFIRQKVAHVYHILNGV